jgi:hypothetical protein
MAPGSRQVFGQTMKKKSKYQRQTGNTQTVYRSGAEDETEKERKAAQTKEFRRKKQIACDEVEKAFAIDRFCITGDESESSRRGWLYNVLPTTVSIFVLG